MAAPLLAVAGAAVGAVGRWGAQQLTRQAIQNQVAKQTFMGVTGLGVLNASPAQAPTLQTPSERVTLSPEASASAGPAPDFSNAFQMFP